MLDIRLFLFGTPRIEYQGTPIRIDRRKAIALAAYLALSQHPVSRDTAAALLWPELDHEHARTALRSALRALTAPLPVAWIQADRTTLELTRGKVWVDVRAFTELLSHSSSHEHNLDTVCDKCAAHYQQALELYRSDFLSGFFISDSASFDDWQRLQTERLRRELASILRRLSIYEAEAGHFEPALTLAQQWLSLDELNEPAHRLIMQLYAVSDQRSSALRQYQRCEDLLNLELASLPEEETLRLYEKIQANQLPKVFAARLSAAGSVSILPPLPSLVVGRSEALRTIKQRLGIGNEKHSITIVQGWPGVGKSTMVALLAHDQEIAQQFPDGILWASLGEMPDIFGTLMAWAEALRLGELDRTRGLAEIRAQITVGLHDRRMLLIVDDVWHSEHAAHFRVGGQFCATVITSRLNDTARILAPTVEDIYSLPVLSEAAGLELFGKLAPVTVAEYPNEARDLVQALEGLPLAIHVAGRLLHSETVMGWGIKDLLVELLSGTALLKAQVPSDMLGIGRETPPTIAALLRRSTDLLDSETHQRFAYLGLFVPKPASFDLAAMAAAWDVPDPKPTIRTLVNRGLLEPVGGGRFQMHALLAAHARSLLEEENAV